MTIIGCFLLPGSCSLAPGKNIPQASVSTFAESHAWSAEFYDPGSGRLIMKTKGHTDTQHAIDEMVQKRQHLKVVLYIEPTFLKK